MGIDAAHLCGRSPATPLVRPTPTHFPLEPSDMRRSSGRGRSTAAASVDGAYPISKQTPALAVHQHQRAAELALPARGMQ